MLVQEDFDEIKVIVEKVLQDSMSKVETEGESDREDRKASESLLAEIKDLKREVEKLEAKIDDMGRQIEKIDD